MYTTEMRQESGKLLYMNPADVPSSTDRGVPTSGGTVSPEKVLNDLLFRLQEDGFDPATQLAGYVMSEDPTFLPEDPDIRAHVRHLGREQLLETLIEGYLNTHPTDPFDTED